VPLHGLSKYCRGDPGRRKKDGSSSEISLSLLS
jgi:hypothetical protein